MSEDKTIEILKSAILLEKRGRAFYSKVAGQTTGKAVKEFFEMMADEQKHKHSSLLEWIIIWLIAFEIVVFLVHDVFKWL